MQARLITALPLLCTLVMAHDGHDSMDMDNTGASGRCVRPSPI
jgi:hypothetical protein